MTTDLRPAARHRARLTSQGQITVPKAVRDALGLRPGDDVEFEARGTTMLVTASPRRSVLDFAGIGATAAGLVPASAEAIDEAIERGMGEAAVARAGRAAAPRAKRTPRPAS